MFQNLTRMLLSPLVAVLVAGPLAAISADQVQGFLGEWTLHMEIQGNPVEMGLQIEDRDGTAVATLSSPRAPQPTTIQDLSLDDDTLRMQWTRDFQGQQMTMQMALSATDDALSGTFGDTGGLFSADISGERAGAATAAAGEGDGDGDGEEPRRRRRAGETATLDLGGKEIKIAYDALKTDSEDFGVLQSLDDGEVFQYVGGRAVKLLTAADLDFGGTTVKQGNAAASYPGVYSMWLKKSGGGWHLVFNQHADVWGTMYDASADAVEIPVEHSRNDVEEEALKVELLEFGEGGLLRIAWGPHQWMANFDIGG